MYGGLIAGSVGYNLVIAVIALVIALAFEDMLYFDSRIIEGGAQELSEIAEALRARSLRVTQEPGGYVVRGPIEAQLSLLSVEGGSRILERMRVAPWFLAAVIIIIALNVAVGLVLAFLGYLYYRNLKTSLDHALA